MNNPLLSQLRDVHLPDPIGWWPLAPGFYGLGILLVLAVVAGGYCLRQHHQCTRAKRQALHLLSLFQSQYQKNQQSVRASARISELLRRVAMTYYPRETVAHLTQEAWLDFLTETGNGINFHAFSFELLQLPFTAPQENQDVPSLIPLFEAVRQWIKHRRGKCSH